MIILSDYIEAYIKAKQNDDKKTMERIEMELATLGMDKATLNILANEIADEIKQ